MILTPALCATILRKPKHHARKRGLFRWFNRGFERGTQLYQRGVRAMIKRMIVSILLFAALVAGTVALFDSLPTAFLPQEDQGRLIATIQLPPGATADRTRRVLDTVIQHYLDTKKKTMSTASSAASASTSAARAKMSRIAFVALKDFGSARRRNPSRARRSSDVP